MSWLDDIVDKLEDVLEKDDPGRLWADYLGASHDVHIARQTLREAEEEYASAKNRALAGDLAPALRRDLRKGRNTLSVLNLLRDVGAEHPRLVHTLLPELYECCLSVNKAGIWGRDILRTLSRTTDLHDDLAPLVAETLRDEEELSDVITMRCLAHLFEDIGDTALMDVLLRAARTSPDADVRELPDDYSDESPEQE